MFRLSNTARKIFWVARIFDATRPNFTNGRAIAPPAPLSPTPMCKAKYGYHSHLKKMCDR